ncbi:hypothetical protein NBRC116188_23450 [Oceaniserpentilla sp. 4NH20-0058]|uniref:hybrid sensor histidine kinase/response regulator n=1 Tax=Oceaniserpentilla sp. 4NH20-0058 TaxID=3127660 RepID=UPI00310A751A
MLALIGSLIVSLLWTSAHASPDHQNKINEPSVFIESPVNQFLGKTLYTFPDGDKTWQELSSLPITDGVQSKADFYNADAFKLPIWVRTDLTTGQIDPNDLWLMGLGSGFAGDVELYLVADGKLISHQKNSPYKTFDSREFDYRLLHFALDLPSHANVQLLLKINFSPIPHYKPTITTEELMEDEEIYWMAWMGFGIGFLVAIGLFHLTLASATYDKVYVYYFLYVFGSGLWFIETHGLLFKYIWPNNPEFMLYFSGFMYYSPIIFAYFFVITFLQLPKISKKFTNYFYFLAALLVLVIVGKVFVPSISLNLAGLIVMISALSFIYAGFYARRKGVYYAKYYIVAWTLYCSSILNMMLYVGGASSFMPNYTYWVLVIVFDIQVMLLAFALAHRIRIIRQSKIEAEADNRAQSEFLARMSHEIRTPINGVLGMAELMVDRLKDETDIYYMNIIRSSGSSLLTIINDILDYSKFTSGKMELESIPFNLQRLAVESFDIFKIKAAEKNIELITDIDFDLPEAVLGDPTRIKQIMLNFISNAIKFTDEGQVVLRVYRETENDRIKISVVDSGEGISKSGQEKLFNAFSQASTSTSRKHGGTGLGLSICKQLTLMMGGEIGLDSEVGKGSTFWISVNLPVSTDFIQEDKIEDVSLEGYNLLIVEDNYTFAELLFNQASLWGMKCQVATNGKEALALLRQNYQVGIQFDLISLDLIMPKMDGIETSKHIFADERFRDIPMLLLTSATNFPSKTALASSGIMRVIEKPTLPADIKRTYKELLIKQEVNSVPALSPSEDEISLPSLSILVAEDNKVNQLVMKGILKRLKQSAVIVDDGELALRAVKESPDQFDLILMDYDMPNMNGITSTVEIRKWEKAESQTPCKIVALTAHAVQSYIDECMEAGMDEYLSKPIDVKKLEALLRSMFL